MADPERYPSQGSEEFLKRNYQDKAAAQLFKDSGGYELTKAVAGLHRALGKQAEKLEEFHSSPFTKQNVKVMLATIEALERGRELLDDWHGLIYPNERRR